MSSRDVTYQVAFQLLSSSSLEKKNIHSFPGRWKLKNYVYIYVISSRVYTYYSMFRYFTSGVMSNSGYSFTSLSPHPIKSSVIPDNGLPARKCGLSQLTFDHSSGISVLVASHLFNGLTWQSQCNEFPERYSHDDDSFLFFFLEKYTFLLNKNTTSYRDTVLSSRCL